MTIPDDIRAAARATDDLYRALTATRRQCARELSAHPDLALRARQPVAALQGPGYRAPEPE